MRVNHINLTMACTPKTNIDPTLASRNAHGARLQPTVARRTHVVWVAYIDTCIMLKL